jgi:hypothetical protein
VPTTDVTESDPPVVSPGRGIREHGEKVAKMKSLHRGIAVSTLVTVVLLALMVPAAGAAARHAQGKVGPDQFFTGVVNGTDGNTSTPITIEMACFGPVMPGQTGHPLGGQTLAVHQLFPPSSTGSLGKTGNDSEIGAFFAAPPAAARARKAQTSPTFTHYDKPKPLSTKLTLPCSGTGTMYFSPLPVVPPSQAATVPVQFAGQP